MPVKYLFVKTYHGKEYALARRKKLEKAGFKVRILDEELRSGKHQYVVYRSRAKGGKG